MSGVRPLKIELLPQQRFVRIPLFEKLSSLRFKLLPVLPSLDAQSDDKDENHDETREQSSKESAQELEDVWTGHCSKNLHALNIAPPQRIQAGANPHTLRYARVEWSLTVPPEHTFRLAGVHEQVCPRKCPRKLAPNPQDHTISQST